jgi:hypothetical protein
VGDEGVVMLAAQPAARCGRCQAALEHEDLRCAICACPTPAAAAEGAAHVKADILRCDTCAAAMAYAAEAQAPRCAFCGSVMHLEQIVDPIDQADALVPFAVAPAQAQAALRRWMGTLGFFRPKDLASGATVDSLRPLFWVAWVFDATALVSWTADSDAGSGRSAWAPHAGQTELEFTRLLVPASRGLTHAECNDLAPAYDVATARPPAEAAAAAPEGTTAEQFDVQRSAARKAIVGAIERTAAARVQAGHIPGSKFRKVKVAVLLRSLVTHRVALPAYVLAYRYRGKLFRAVVNGQDDACAFGDAPLSLAKVVLVAGLALAALALVGLLLAR